MALKIRKNFNVGRQMGYAIENMKTGMFYDFSSKQFDSDPDGSYQKLVENWLDKSDSKSMAFMRGAYANVDPNDKTITELATPIAVFTPGVYTLYFVDMSDVHRIVALETWIAQKADGADGVDLLPLSLVMAQASASVSPSVNINLPPDMKIVGGLEFGLADIAAKLPSRQPHIEHPPEAG